MVTTGTVLTNGTAEFQPLIERLLEITKEFVPYFIYITIGVVGVSIIWGAVKMIMRRLSGGSRRAVRGK